MSCWRLGVPKLSDEAFYVRNNFTATKKLSFSLSIHYFSSKADSESFQVYFRKAKAVFGLIFPKHGRQKYVYHLQFLEKVF